MNSTNNTVAALTADIVQEVYEDYVFTLVTFSSTALGFYATLTKLSQEKEHIWSRPFSLPTLLYIYSRYGTLLVQGLSISMNFIPLGRSCNIIIYVQDTILLLPYIGIQGLLGIRAYSLCQGNKILISALTFGFFAGCSLNLYGIIISPGCVPSNAITNLLIFGICTWKVWGIWRLKCNDGIESSGSLISVLLTQSISRCCFVVTITVADLVITWLESSPESFGSQSYTFMQNALSAILVADFTLDLRRLNSAKIEASQKSLPQLRFSNVLQHVHQSFLVEMATPRERNIEEEAGDNYHDDNLAESTNDTQAAEVN